MAENTLLSQILKTMDTLPRGTLETTTKALDKPSLTSEMREALLQHIKWSKPGSEIEFRFGNAYDNRFVPGVDTLAAKSVILHLRSKIDEDNQPVLSMETKRDTVYIYNDRRGKGNKDDGKTKPRKIRKIVADDGETIWQTKEQDYRLADKCVDRKYGFKMTHAIEQILGDYRTPNEREEIVRKRTRRSFTTENASSEYYGMRVDVTEVISDKGISNEVEVELLLNVIKHHFLSKKEEGEKSLMENLSRVFTDICSFLSSASEYVTEYIDVEEDGEVKQVEEKIYVKSPYILTCPEKTRLFKLYNEFAIEHAKGANNEFFGKPTFNHRFLNKPTNIKPDTFALETNPWYLTLKTDGMRVFLLFTYEGVYACAPPQYIIKVSDYNSDEKRRRLIPTILEAEKMGREFYVFDCLQVNGSKTTNLSFAKRMFEFEKAFGILSLMVETNSESEDTGFFLKKKEFFSYAGLPELYKNPDEKITKRTQIEVEAIKYAEKLEKLRVEKEKEEKQKKEQEKQKRKQKQEKAGKKKVAFEGDEPLGVPEDETPEERVARLREEMKKKVEQDRKQRELEKEVEEEAEEKLTVPSSDFEEVFSKLSKIIKKDDKKYDGIIFQSSGPYASGYFPKNNKTFKYKQSDKLSIDFLAKWVDGYYDLYTAENKKFVGSEEHKYPRKGKEFVYDEDGTLDGKIVEVRWTGRVFEFMRERKDKMKANSMGAALSVWEDMREPYVPGDKSEGFGLMRAFHNTVKRRLLTENFRPGDHLVDGGTARGADVNKWDEIRLGQVLAIEPDNLDEKKEEHIPELKRRIKGMKGDTKVHILKTGLEDTSSIVAEIKKQKIVPKGLSLFFCLTFFRKGTEKYENLLKTIAKVVPDHGVVVGVVLDGEKAQEKLEKKNGLYETDNLRMEVIKKKEDGEKIKKLSITIKDGTGRKASLVDYEEYFFDYDDFKGRMLENNFEEKASFILDDTYNEGIFSKLSRDSAFFSSMNRTFLFVKKPQKVANSSLSVGQEQPFSQLFSPKTDMRYLKLPYVHRNAFMTAVYYCLLEKFRNTLEEDREKAARLVEGKIKKLAQNIEEEEETFFFSKYGKIKLNSLLKEGYSRDDARRIAKENYLTILLNKETKEKTFIATHVSLCEILSYVFDTNIVVVDSAGRPLTDSTSPDYNAEWPYIIISVIGRDYYPVYEVITVEEERSEEESKEEKPKKKKSKKGKEPEDEPEEEGTAEKKEKEERVFQFYDSHDYIQKAFYQTSLVDGEEVSEEEEDIFEIAEEESEEEERKPKGQGKKGKKSGFFAVLTDGRNKGKYVWLESEERAVVIPYKGPGQPRPDKNRRVGPEDRRYLKKDARDPSVSFSGYKKIPSETVEQFGLRDFL